MRLRQLCEEYHYTEEYLAQVLNVDLQIIKGWERELPPLKDFLRLAECFFGLAPLDLLDDGEAIPEFKLGMAGSVSYGQVVTKVLQFLRDRADGGVIEDRYHHVWIVCTDEMFSDVLSMAFRLTDLYSRFAVSLEDNEWKEFLGISDVLEDTDTGAEEMLRDVFSPYTGVLQNTEVRNAAECLDILEKKYTSGVGKNLANRMGITLIDMYRLAGSAAAAPDRQWILCERIFMELLHYMGQIVDESAAI